MARGVELLDHSGNRVFQGGRFIRWEFVQVLCKYGEGCYEQAGVECIPVERFVATRVLGL